MKEEYYMQYTMYMDFMKAFDKVPHTRLLEKMKAYGLSENICILGTRRFEHMISLPDFVAV